MIFNMNSEHPAGGVGENRSSATLLFSGVNFSNISNGTLHNSSSAVSPGNGAVLGLVLVLFILIALVGNILVILSVVFNRHLQTATNYFIINLAIADLLLSTTVLPFSATWEITGYWIFGRIFCDIWAAVDVLCCTASIMSLCAISIDRYIGVRYSLRYPSIVTEKKAVLAVVGVWLLSIVISIGPLLGWKQPAPLNERECQITEEPGYALFSSLGSFYIPLTVILVMYCRVYIVAKRTTKNLEAGVMKETSDSSELTLRIHCRNIQDDPIVSRSKGHHARSSLSVRLLKFSREKKAAKTLGIVVGMFILCWLPFFIALPIGSLFPNLRPTETVFKVVFWLGYSNSCVNPIIYSCSSKEFKRAFIRILKGQCHRRRRPVWRVYNYNWKMNSLDQQRKDSVDDGSIIFNGNERRLSSMPSPCYSAKNTTQSMEMCSLRGWRLFPSFRSSSFLANGPKEKCEFPRKMNGEYGVCTDSTILTKRTTTFGHQTILEEFQQNVQSKTAPNVPETHI
ncbi:alpha-1A adrenergic receptor-like isoform X1 [Scyliorhinus canicula]|uniref:alpha-1A adrenergic receptor-like isoform X1 n=2 Tax=Scyliorhinus canicula TaxID=7830 RepID=UPI0018F51846|nr:alpha-1A adrenergic receptor-like isoform X1 [Scyliorhinus canicula]